MVNNGRLSEPRNARPPAGGDRARRAVAALLGVATIWIPAAAINLAALLVFTYRCDDGCAGSAAGWGGVAAAWQWSLQFYGFAVPAIVLATVTVALLGLGTPRAASIAARCTVALTLGWFAFPALSGGRPLSSLDGLLDLAGYFAGVRADWPVLALWILATGGWLCIRIRRAGAGVGIAG